MAEPLRVLAVDDVAPALDEIGALLADAPGVGEVTRAGDAVEALRAILTGRFDAVFLDIAMPGIDGLELGGLLAAMAVPPEIVFVTAFEEHAVAAYGLGAVDYLLKPVGPDRLADALTRVHRARAGRSAAGRTSGPDPAAPAPAPAPTAVPESEPTATEPVASGSVPEPAGGPTAVVSPGPAPQRVDELAVLPVEIAGRTRYVRRDDVRFVEAHGDYVRLHTPAGSHLVRIALSRLEVHWDAHRFVRVHRSFLVRLSAVRELRSDASGGLLAHTDVGDVPVSRRHARELRERLMAAATSGALSDPGRA